MPSKQKTSGAPEPESKDKPSVVLNIVPDVSALHRLPKESEPAYQAWLLYAELKSSGQGGTAEVARRCSKHVSLIQRWSVRHGWKERLRLYQKQQQLLQEREEKRALRKRVEEWASRRIDIRESGFELGAALIKRGKALLELPIAEKEVRNVVKVGEQTIETLTILNFIQHPRDAKTFIEAGIKLQRMSADMSSENLSLLSDDVDLDSMTEEELAEYATRLMEMRKQTAEKGE